MVSTGLLVGIRSRLGVFFIFQTARPFWLAKFIFVNRTLQLKCNRLTSIRTLTWGRFVCSPFFIQRVNFFLLNYKHFHFTDSKVLVSCEERGTIFTEWTLVRVVETSPAVFRIWFIDNNKIVATPKCWPKVTAATDGICLLSWFQSHLCWWQTAWVDKAEQERAWCLSPITRSYGKKGKSLLTTIFFTTDWYQGTGKMYSNWPSPKILTSY